MKIIWTLFILNKTNRSLCDSFNLADIGENGMWAHFQFLPSFNYITYFNNIDIFCMHRYFHHVNLIISSIES